MPTIVATYERVSTQGQEQHGFGLAAQRQSLEQLIAANPGWIHPAHLTFRDVGSGSERDRPGLNAMLDAAERGLFDVVVIPDVDRLSRRLADAIAIEEELKRNGVRVVYETMPSADESAEMELQRNILRSFAQFERSKIARRVSAGRQQKAREGKVVGQGVAPYGYRFTYTMEHDRQRVVGLEPDPETAPVAREILLAVRERSTIAIADELNERGIPSPSGIRWNYPAITHMAKSTTYAGVWRYGKSSNRPTIDVAVPALITKAEHEEILHQLDRRRKTRTGRLERDPFSLRGALRCGLCGGPLKTTINNQARRYYVCGRRCAIPAVPAVPIEREFVRVLSYTFFNEEATARFIANRQQRLAEEAAQWEKRQVQVARKIEQERGRLSAVLDRLIDAGTSEIGRMLQEKAELIEKTIVQLQSVLDEPCPSVSETDESDALEAMHAHGMELGFAMASPVWLRQFIAGAGIYGEVRPADEGCGIKLGRLHTFTIDWRADIPLKTSSEKRLPIQFTPEHGGEIALAPPPLPLSMAAD